MGITGAREELDALARTVVSKVRDSETGQLAAVGIGISTSEQVAEVNSYADAAIVGSVFVRAYAEGGIAAVKRKVQELKSIQE
jgi:tryptophan synthase alpha chain